MEAVNLIKYTVSDIMSLPEGERAELIDGRWYDMATPGATHQMIVASLATDMTNYFREEGDQVSFDEEIPCKLYPDLQLVLAKGL